MVSARNTAGSQHKGTMAGCVLERRSSTVEENSRGRADDGDVYTQSRYDVTSTLRARDSRNEGVAVEQLNKEPDMVGTAGSAEKPKWSSHGSKGGLDSCEGDALGENSILIRCTSRVVWQEFET